jgi:hypothetical protein
LKGSYFPTPNPGTSDNSQYFDSIRVAFNGSDISHGATGNASGTVGFGRSGVETASYGGERFGIEEREARLGWTPNYAAASPSAAGNVVASLVPRSAHTHDRRGMQVATAGATAEHVAASEEARQAAPHSPTSLLASKASGPDLSLGASAGPTRRA